MLSRDMKNTFFKEIRKSPWLKVAKGPRPEEVKTPLGRGCL